MKIYLYGIQGVYNYGCEAMVRGVSEKLSSIYPNCEIIYKTENIEDDSRRLSDCKTVILEPIEKKVFKGIQRNIIYRGIRFIKKKLNIAKTDDYIHINTEWVKECDVLIIIGGDVFDRIPSQKKYQNNRILISKMVKEYGGKVVLWGISVGSFDEDSYAKKVLLEYFRNNVDLAIIRDKKSYAYLRDNGIKNNVTLYSDPAYMLKSLQYGNSHEERKVLGINLSPLSNAYLNYEKSDEEWIEVWADIIFKIYTRLSYDEIILIPHVVIPSYSSDDDFSYLSKIFRKLNDKGANVTFVDTDEGFLGVKKYIVKCDLMISARMHCSINSITCGVPTVFLSYSPKSIGMCNHVYGTDKMVLNMNELVEETDDEITKLQEISPHVDEIKKYLSIKNEFLYKDASDAVLELKDYFKDNKDERNSK